MQPNAPLPPQMIQDDLVAQAKKNDENLKSSAVKFNEISSDYRNTLSLIDEKLIFLSAGSISLLLTFLGILFNSTRNSASLHYVFVFISIFAFLATIILLLLARYLWSLFIISIAHGHYLKNMKAKYETEVKMMRSGGQIISDTDYSQMSQDDIEKSAKKIEKHIKDIENQIKKSGKREKIYSKRAKTSAILAYGTMISAYIFATLFFGGVVDILNMKK